MALIFFYSSNINLVVSKAFPEKLPRDSFLVVTFLLIKIIDSIWLYVSLFKKHNQLVLLESNEPQHFKFDVH